MFRLSYSIFVVMLLTACQTNPERNSIREAVKPAMLKNITKSELVVLFNNRDTYSRQYQIGDEFNTARRNAAGSYGLLGELIGAVLINATEGEKARKKNAEKLQNFARLKPYLNADKIENSLPRVLYGKLKNISVLKLKKASKMVIQMNKDESFADANKRYLRSIVGKSASDIVAVANVGHFFNAELSEFMLKVEFSLFPKNRLIPAGGKLDPISDLPILYRNTFYYSAEQKGALGDNNASVAWTTDPGKNHIKHVLKRSVPSLSSLIKHDVSMFLKKTGEKKLKKDEVFKTVMLKESKGSVIAESKNRSVIRESGSNRIFSFDKIPDMESVAYNSGTNKEMATIYILRNSYYGWGVDQDIYLNKKYQGILPNEAYFLLHSRPGKSKLVIKTGGAEKNLTFTAKAGYSYYITQQITLGLLNPQVSLTPVPRHIGNPLVSQLKKVVYDPDASDPNAF